MSFYNSSMVTALKRTVTVQAGGLVEVRSDELPAGASAEVIILLANPSHQRATGSPPSDPLQALDALQRSLHLDLQTAQSWAAANREERQASSDRLAARIP